MDVEACPRRLILSCGPQIVVETLAAPRSRLTSAVKD
jgi:hypothetical protein